MTAPSTSHLRAKWLLRLAAWMLIAVFGWAGVAKLADPAAFATAIDGYRLTPPFASAIMAVYLPWFEIALAAGLLTHRLRSSAALLAAVLMLVFTIATGLALARGLDIECGCFGSAHPTPLHLALIRDIGLFLAAALLAHNECS